MTMIGTVLDVMVLVKCWSVLNVGEFITRAASNLRRHCLCVQFARYNGDEPTVDCSITLQWVTS